MGSVVNHKDTSWISKTTTNAQRPGVVVFAVMTSLCVVIVMVYSSTETRLQEEISFVGEGTTKDVTTLYTDVTQFLHSSSDDISVATTPFFLSNVKNPCFALDQQNRNIRNISLQYALQNKLKIKCLPYVYQLGVTKSGTSDLFAHVTKYHPQILRSRKELHFWDDSHYLSPTIADFTQHLEGATKTIVKSFTKNSSPSEEEQYIIAEGTPRTFWDGNFWKYDPLNQGLELPRILMPHKIHHVTPHNKFIVIMRDPTTRLFSDYNFFYKRLSSDKVSPQDFQRKVLDSIEWWKKCTELHPEKRCLYGPTPEGLPQLDTDNCILNKTETYNSYVKTYKAKKERKCNNHFYWAKRTAARLRIGLYEPIIKDWLSVFRREQMLFIKFEEYITNNLEVIQNQIYPFLGLPKLAGKNLQALQDLSDNKDRKPHSHTVMTSRAKEALREFYGPYNKRLSKLLGDEKWLWK